MGEARREAGLKPQPIQTFERRTSMTTLSELTAYLQAELEALAHPEVARWARKSPDCTIGVYATRTGTPDQRVTVTLSSHNGLVDKDCPLEEVADYVDGDGYKVASYKDLYNEPGLRIRLYISAEKRFSAEEKKLLKATNHLVTKRYSQAAVVCGI
jgi:hypothetical protein